MKPEEILKSYYQFVKEQREEKYLKRMSIMLLLLDTITNEVNVFGWVKKGNGSVTDTMVKSGIMKFNFVKEYHGEKVVITISVNINDDYPQHGYSQITVKGSKPVNVNPHWLTRNDGSSLCFPEWDLTNTYREKFFLENILKNIDTVYN